ncbi:MAG: hypothetical protein OEZ03_17665 [Alphaproteobacteria bacterium]|nr:hypothetical protein [Alphaproteobacteria bacterium]MDH5559179.1 hypothetical protein [Alphaproteobacteria bacterium]
MNELPDKQISEEGTPPGTWRKIWEFPTYPLIAACLLALNIYVNNLSAFPNAAIIVRPVILGILAGAMLTYGLSLLLRSWHRGGLLAAVLLLTLSYGDLAATPIAKLIGQTTNFTIGSELPLLVIFLAVVTLSVLNRIPPVVTVAANVWASFLLLVLLITWASNWIMSDDGNPMPADTFASAKAPNDRPDIYHITLDGYARGDILRDYFGFDNAIFLGRIRSFGFAVSDRAITPYNQTQLAMLSIFDGTYLYDSDTGKREAEINYRRRINERFLESSTFKTLTRMGYRVAGTNTEYLALDIGRNEMIAPRPWSEMTLLELTVFDQSVLGLIADRFGSLDPRTNHALSMIRDAYNAPFAQTLERPVFLFTHQLAPHRPFNITRNGGRREMIDLKDVSNFQNGLHGLRAEYVEGYTEKLRFINDETAEYLQRLVTELPDPKIVIVHGDHGSALHMRGEDIAVACAKERYSPLLAVYSSDGLLQARLNDDFNLVNLYRLVFNTYFETDLPMLESKNYFAPYPEPSKHSPVGSEAFTEPCPSPG